MKESPPATASPEERAASEETVAQEETPRGKRRRLRVPTSVIVTVIVAALSVLVAPAFTRQWDDRQKVRELRATFADEIATASARTLSAGSEVARVHRQLEVRRDRLAPVHASWDVARLRIEMKLRAYYRPQIANDWKKFGEDVHNFLEICLLTGPTPRGGRYSAGVIRADLVQQFTQIGLRRKFGLPVSLETMLTAPDAGRRAFGLEVIGRHLLRRADAMTASVFAVNPDGFSTTRGDLLRDLLP